MKQKVMPNILETVELPSMVLKTDSGQLYKRRNVHGAKWALFEARNKPVKQKKHKGPFDDSLAPSEELGGQGYHANWVWSSSEGVRSYNSF